MRKIFFVLSFALSFTSWVEGQTILQGQVVRKKKPLLGVTVKLTQQDVLIKETTTDAEGNYQLSMEPGNYEVEMAYSNCQTQRTEGLNVLAQKTTVLDITLSKMLSFELRTVCVPMIQKDDTSTGRTYTADQIGHMY